MAKNIIEDVRPPRSIRDIPLPDNRKARQMERPPLQRVMEPAPESESEMRSEVESDGTHNNDIPQIAHSEYKPPLRIGKYIAWVVAIICVIVLFFAVSNFFTSAIVTVTPKTQVASINASVPVAYELISLTSVASTTVPAHGQVQVSQKASGQIVVYNDYSASSQTLIATTRFESSNGLIYRTPTQITIPGMKGTVPGSLTITVYADQPGSNYNIGLTDFTIPGLQSDQARYKGMYGRSKTTMTGGESGMVPDVLAGDKAAAEDVLISQLQSRLSGLAQAQTSVQYLFSAATATTTFKLLTSASAASSAAGASQTSAVLSEQGTITALVFDRADLAEALASTSQSGYDGNAVAIQDASQLNISLANPVILQSSLNQPNGTTASTTALVNGSATLVWQYSADDLKAALKGKPSSQIDSVLADFPEITKADVAIKPFWITSLPDNTNKITIVTASGYMAQ